MANGTTDTSGAGTPNTTGGLQGSHHIEIKDADAVQAGLAGGFNWIEQNAKLFVALIVCAILAAIAYVGVQFVGRRQESQAQEAYYKVESEFLKKREEFERAKFKSFLPAEQTKDAPPAVAASGDLAKDYGPLITDMEKIAKDNAGTAAGAQAAILAGETYLAYKQPDKAMELAQLPAEKLSKDHTFSHLSRILWGNAAAAKGDCQQAVSIWQPLLQQESAAYLQGDVALRSGVCFEQMNQTDKAMEMYRKASAGSPESTSAETAKGLMRALELKGGAATAAAPAVQPAANAVETTK